MKRFNEGKVAPQCFVSVRARFGVVHSCDRTFSSKKFNNSEGQHEAVAPNVCVSVKFQQPHHHVGFDTILEGKRGEKVSV